MQKPLLWPKLTDWFTSIKEEKLRVMLRYTLDLEWLPRDSWNISFHLQEFMWNAYAYIVKAFIVYFNVTEIGKKYSSGTNVLLTIDQADFACQEIATDSWV